MTVSIQDFCNLLGGGLVSLSTIHADTLAVIGSMSSGAVICVYKYSPADVLERAKEEAEEEEEVYETPVIFADIPEKKSKKQAAKEAEKAAKAEAAKAEAEAAAAAKDESGTILGCHVRQIKHLLCSELFRSFPLLAVTVILPTPTSTYFSSLLPGGHHFYAMCWRGVTRTMNVMCGKTEIESMKHQLSALGVLRPKIAAIRKEIVDPDAPALKAEPAADDGVKMEDTADADEANPAEEADANENADESEEAEE